MIAAASLVAAAGCSDSPAVGISLVIDGKKQAVTGSVSCSSHSGGDEIEVGDIRVMLSAAEDRHLVEAELGKSTGRPLVAGDNTRVSILNGGDYDYDITGNAMPQDPKDSTPPKPFELKIKCPSPSR
jgi:hypothetical protein